MAGDVESESAAEAAALGERVRQLEAATTKLSVLLETGRLLSAEMSLERLLDKVMLATTRVLDAERYGVFFVDEEHGELWSKVAQGVDRIRFPITRGIAGHVARTGEVVNLADAYQDSRFNPEIDRTTGFRTRSLLAVPLKDSKGKVLGVVQVLNHRSGRPFAADDVEVLSALAAQAAIAVENARLYEQIEKLFEAFVTTIVYAIDARDPTTAGHSHRVADYSLNLARAADRADRGPLAGVRFSPEELRAVQYASLLHDVGKIGVKESVLCKRYTLLVPELALVDERLRRARAEAEVAAWRSGRPPDRAATERHDQAIEVVARRRYPRPLEAGDEQVLAWAHGEGLLTDRQYECLRLRSGNLIDAEWDDMASHVSKSYDLLRQMRWPEPLARVPEIAWSHHEKLDGSGYPRGVKGPDFPFEGRILAIADIFDALTASDRPYKRAYNRDEAREILDDEARRRRVDADLVELFFEAGCGQLSPGTPLPPPEPPPDPPL